MKRQCVGVLVMLFFIVQAGVAQWSTSSSVNTTICTGNKDRYAKQITSDGAGGLLVTWYEDSTDGTGNVRVQRLNASGTALWASNGLRVCTGVSVENPQVVSDGAGGAIVAWHDARFSDTVEVYAQHVNAAGQIQWAANGVDVSKSYAIEDYDPQMVSDGAGGAFIAWDGAFGVFVIRVGGNGQVLWNTALLGYWGGTDMRMVNDNSGGVILVWSDDRDLTGDILDLYAQRLNSSGAPMWDANGALVCNAVNLQSYPEIASDGSNGAVIVWQDFRDGNNFHAYAQRMSSSGARMWTTPSDSNGVRICNVDGSDQGEVYVASDGSAGGIVSWEDARAQTDDIYAQHVSAAGQIMWDSSGVGLCVKSTFEADPRIASDGNGGAIVIWDDNRNSGANQDIYAQRVSGTGQVRWATNGIAICSASSNQNTPLLTTSSTGGFFAIWDDYRNGGGGNRYADYYVQNFDLNGTLTDVSNVHDTRPASFALLQNYPNPFNPSTTIRYQIPTSEHVTLDVVNILGQRVATLINGQQPAGTYSVQWSSDGVASGVYFYRLTTNGRVEMKKMILLK
jgi:hypothetical protein